MLMRMSQARVHALTVGLALLLALPGGSWAQAIQGGVLGEGDEGPVRQALVHLLPDSGEVVLSSRVSGDGRFVMDLPGAGRYRLKVEALGYATLTTEVVEVGAAEMVTVEVRLRRNPIALEPLEVVVDRRLEPPFMREVRQRASAGFGRLITREELQDRFGSRLEDVLSGVAGLWITYVAAQDEVVPRVPLVTARLKTTAGRTCFADLYLNGVRQFDAGMEKRRYENALENVLEMFSYRADEIEAIEVYRGPAEVPAQYSGSTAECGVVAVWLRGAFGPEFSRSLPYTGPDPNLTLSLTGGRYAVSGKHAPGPGTTLEAAAHWRVWRGVGLGLRIRRGTHELPLAAAQELFWGSGYAPPEGPLALSVLALGVEPRLVLARTRRVRPVLALRGEIAGRTMEYPPPLIVGRRLHFRSSAWGWGAAAGVEAELGRGVALDLALTEERLRFGGYSTLDRPTKSTASSWRVRALRFGLSWTWGS